MKRMIRNILILAMMFILPISVYADESSTFKSIDLDPSIKLTYKVDGKEFTYTTNLYNEKINTNNIHIYKLNSDNTRIELNRNGSFVKINDNNFYRMNGTFNKGDKYVIEYIFNVVINNDKVEMKYEEEYTYDTSHKNSTEDGIVVKIEKNNIREYITPKILIKKVINSSSANETFTFNIKSYKDNGRTLNKNIELTTTGGTGYLLIDNLNLSTNTTYVVSEINIPLGYETVSIESNSKINSNLNILNGLIVETGGENTITSITSNSISKITNPETTSANSNGVKVNMLRATSNANEPAHNKDYTINDDGTYTLSLDVTGANEKSVKKANVVVILDISGSMNDKTIEYYASNRTDETMYGLVDGKYIELTRTRELRYHNYGWHYDYVYYLPDGNEYTDQRYLTRETNESRIDAAVDAVKSLSNSLLSNNDPNSTDKKDVVELALVTFSTTADLKKFTINGRQVTKTTRYSDVENSLRNYYGDSSSVTGGTNWEDALTEANVNFGDSDDTYVIFVSDGNPTFRNTKGSPTPGYLGNNWIFNYGSNKTDQQLDTRQSGVYGSGYDIADRNNSTAHSSRNVERCYNESKDEANDLVRAGKKFYAIGAYGDVDRMEDLADYAYGGAGKGSDYYYNASDTTQLNNALDEILNEIQRSGIGDVTIADGTTSSVKTTTGVDTNLLTIDEHSFNYWLSFNVESNGKIKFNETEVTITPNTDPNNTAGNYVLSWTEKNQTKSVTINGKYNEAGNVFEYKWESANQLYNHRLPTATIADGTDENVEKGTVVWDLHEAGTLLNNVKYTVKFNVWPSQYTYDLIAKYNNSTAGSETSYENEDANIKKYLIQNPDGSYTLKTNTKATLTYTDTRTTDGEQTAKYDNPEPVPTGVSQINITKTVLNYLDPDVRDVDTVKIDLLRDNHPYGTSVILTKNSEGSLVADKNTFISVGLISTVKENNQIVDAIIREDGYDYTFNEIEAYYNGKRVSTYHWDLLINTIHPMMVDKELKMLVKTTNKEFDGKNVITENGKVKYVLMNGITYEVQDAPNGITTLSAVNSRRSNLNLTKEISGTVPTGTKFTFNVTIDSTDNEDIWFSIYESADSNTPIKTDGIVTSVSDTVINKEFDENGEFTGFYYVADNKPFAVNLETGWNLRITNLPIGSTYNIVETLSSDFRLINSFVQTGYRNPDTEDHEWIFEDADTNYTTVNKNNKTVEGNIYIGNRLYSVTYTNEHLITSISGQKIWLDGDNPDNRPNNIIVNLYRNNTKLEGEEYSRTLNNSNNWSYSFINLPKYEFNTAGEIVSTYTYSVDEEDVPEGYRRSFDGSNIVNTLQTTVNGQKIWEDNDDNDEKRPESITVLLYRNNEEEPIDSLTIIPDEDGNWYYSFENLDMYDENNNLISYRVEEDVTSLPDDMQDKYISETDEDGNLINTYIDTTISISLEKRWINKTGEKVIFEIYTEDELANFTPIEVELNTGNTFKQTIDNLKKYYINEDTGKPVEIIYKVRELSVDGISFDDGTSEIEIYITRNGIKTNELEGTWKKSDTELINGVYTITNTWDEGHKTTLNFKKVAFGALSTPLEGAIFRLYRYILDGDSNNEILSLNSSDVDSDRWILVAEIGGEGISTFNFGTLYVGEYRLVEVQAPNEFILPSGQWKIEVKEDSNKPHITGIGVIPALIETDSETGEYLIPNQHIPDIPSTGGIGIPHYDRYGITLMLLSICIFIINLLKQNKKIEII